MIKVGQIYKDEDGILFVITWYDDQWVNPEIGTIAQDGYTMKNDMTSRDINLNDFGTHYKLVAEYPTWEEAVNSKEFKGE